MWRVLRIGTGLMGLLLILMTSGLWLSRRAGYPPPNVIIGEKEPEGVRLLHVAPTFRYEQQISPQFERIYSIGASTDGQWLYVEARTAQDPLLWGQNTVKIFRLRINGRQLEPISGYTLEGDPVLSPDRQFIIYSTQQSNGAWELRRVRTNGEDDIAISPPIMPSSRLYAPTTFSSDHQWLYFSESAYPDSIVWRVSMDGANAEKLFIGAIPQAERTSLDTNGWLIVEDHSLYQMRLDGSGIRKVTPFSSEKSSFEYLIDHVGNVALVKEEDFYPLLGVSLETNAILWSIPDFEYKPDLSNSEWLWFYKPATGELARVRPDGQEFEIVTTVPYFANVLGWLSNGKLLISAPIEDVWLAWLMTFDLETGQIDKIGRTTPHVRIGGWSPDKRWLCLYQEGRGFATWTWLLDAAGNHLLQIAVPSDDRWLAEWLPTLDYAWDAWLLLLGGGILLAASMCPLNIRRLRHRILGSLS